MKVCRISARVLTGILLLGDVRVFSPTRKNAGSGPSNFVPGLGFFELGRFEGQALEMQLSV